MELQCTEALWDSFNHLGFLMNFFLSISKQNPSPTSAKLKSIFMGSINQQTIPDSRLVRWLI